MNVITVYIYSYFRFCVSQTGQSSEEVSGVATASETTHGRVGSHTTISPHHLHYVFSARRKGLQKLVTNCKAARNPSELLEQFVSKRQLLLSLSAAGFLARPFERNKSKQAPNLRTSFVALP